MSFRGATMVGNISKVLENQYFFNACIHPPETLLNYHHVPPATLNFLLILSDRHLLRVSFKADFMPQKLNF